MERFDATLHAPIEQNTQKKLFVGVLSFLTVNPSDHHAHNTIFSLTVDLPNLSLENLHHKLMNSLFGYENFVIITSHLIPYGVRALMLN